MKVAIVSDTQFDQQLSNATIGADGISSRLQDSITCFDWVVKTACERGCSTLIHLGDLFDSRTEIDVSVLDAVGDAFARARDSFTDIHLLVGNHDSYLRNPRVNSLRVLSGMARVHSVPSTVGPFAFVPWVEDDAVFAEQVQTLALAKHAQYLFAHCIVEGAVPMIAKARSIETLKPNRWKHIILGDVHEPVVLSPKIRYAGAPMQWHYGDAGGKRGFLILDTETDKLEFIENTVSPRFHKLTVVSDAANVRTDDFARVESSDPVRAAKIVGQVLKKVRPARLETTVVEIPQTEVRLDLRVNDEQEEVLRRWIDYRDVKTDKDELLALGLEILRAARKEQ